MPRLTRFVGDASPPKDLGKAPVHDLHLTVAAHQHVRGFQVAMDHAPGVRVRHRLADLLEDLQQSTTLLLELATGLQQRRQGVALDELHGEVGPAVRLDPEAVHRNHTRMLELPFDLRFFDEALDDSGRPSRSRARP